MKMSAKPQTKAKEEIGGFEKYVKLEKPENGKTGYVSKQHWRTKFLDS